MQKCGAEVNLKKTKTVASSKSGNVGLHCSIIADGTIVEEVSQYKYLGSWITLCEPHIKTRIAMAKDAYKQHKHKKLLRGNVNLVFKKSKEFYGMLLCFSSLEVLM